MVCVMRGFGVAVLRLAWDTLVSVCLAEEGLVVAKGNSGAQTPDKRVRVSKRASS